MRKYILNIRSFFVSGRSNKVGPSRADMLTQQQEQIRRLEQQEQIRRLEEEEAKRLLEQEAVVSITSSDLVGLGHGGFVSRNPKQKPNNSICQ